MPNSDQPLSLEDFMRLLERELELEDVDEIRPDDHFLDDLGLDSMILLELAYILEDEGIELSYNDAFVAETPRQAYGIYLKLFAEKTGSADHSLDET